MFCVKCGREGELHGGLCGECFTACQAFITFPEVVNVDICVHCGSRKKGKAWVRAEGREQILEEVIHESAKKSTDVEEFDVHLKTECEDESNVKADIVTHAAISSLTAEEKHRIKVRFKKSVCSECSKRQGGYWEAKVQLRGDKKGVSEEDIERVLGVVDLTVAERENRDRNAFITKIEKMHSGLDFYTGSKELGKAITKRLAMEFAAQVKESAKLMGRKEGKDIYRMTYLVRLPGFHADDFIELDDEVFKIVRITSGGVLLRSLKTQSDVKYPAKDLESVRIIGGPASVKNMVVVSHSAYEIQVLDPDTLKTVDVVLPAGVKIKGESVRIFKHNSDYFVVD